jgi:hypothetical protein
MARVQGETPARQRGGRVEQPGMWAFRGTPAERPAVALPPSYRQSTWFSSLCSCLKGTGLSVHYRSGPQSLSPRVYRAGEGGHLPYSPCSAASTTVPRASLRRPPRLRGGGAAGAERTCATGTVAGALVAFVAARARFARSGERGAFSHPPRGGVPVAGAPPAAVSNGPRPPVTLPAGLSRRRRGAPAAAASSPRQREREGRTAPRKP